MVLALHEATGGQKVGDDDDDDDGDDDDDDDDDDDESMGWPYDSSDCLLYCRCTAVSE